MSTDVADQGPCAEGAGTCIAHSCTSRRPFGPAVYEWRRADVGFYEFAEPEYEVNITDQEALSVAVPDVRRGDELRVQFSGFANPDDGRTGVVCELQAYVMTHLSDTQSQDRPIDQDGNVSFYTESPPTRIAFGGIHIAADDGVALIRVRGRVASGQCGIGKDVVLRVDHDRVAQ